jgi:hypothetical protein
MSGRRDLAGLPAQPPARDHAGIPRQRADPDPRRGLRSRLARRGVVAPDQPKPGRFFVALTFDDGYRDNLEDAWPVLAKHEAPWTLFVTPGFADRSARLWWLELEEAIRACRASRSICPMAAFPPARKPMPRSSAPSTGSTGVCANSRKRFCSQ